MKQLCKRTKSHKRWKHVVKSPSFKYDYSQKILSGSLMLKLHSLSLKKSMHLEDGQGFSCKRQLDLCSTLTTCNSNTFNEKEMSETKTCTETEKKCSTSAGNVLDTKESNLASETQIISANNDNFQQNDNDTTPDELAIYLDNFLVLPSDKMSHMAEMMYM